ncbi:hypothetical protein HGA88_06955 [Candidatus Roizmanbacteria bacterium]|nr:hypothetical protein [Candidatus Roizmanbacteria bacterium]
MRSLAFNRRDHIFCIADKNNHRVLICF